MADEQFRVPPPHPPAASGPANLPASPVTAPPGVNGEARGPAVAPAPHRPPGGDLRSAGKAVWELVWPPTGAQVAQADSVREVVETVVFVVVLVLLLKSFAAEAFVIPTGSMAETLWGYQRVVTCPQCGSTFPVNCSGEVDPQGDEHTHITACTCPNCRFHIDNVDNNPEWHWNSGDRVLVAKSLFELGLMKPERRDVVVFKFPGDSSFPARGPQYNHVPMNYIKRLIGLGGETIGIWYGKLYAMTEDQQTEEDRQADPLVLWKHQFMHEDKFKDELEHLDDTPPAQRRFHMLRKGPKKILALRRLVYDNDHQAKDLANLPRWAGESAGPWAADQADGFHAAGGEGTAWLRYSHVLRPEGGSAKPQLITDVMGYNDFESVRAEPDGRALMEFRAHTPPPHNWVGDLILECEVTVDRPSGELILELSKGVDRFRARWDLPAGTCTLVRVRGDKEEPLGSKPSVLKPGTAHRLRFANVDDRLTVWVDDALPFEDGVEYEPSAQREPTAANDLQPASVGAHDAALGVHHLKLWRDTYYTLDAGGGSSDSHLSGDDWADPEKWAALRHLPAKTYFVQPGHYLCLGDNSPESSDGRSWGTVPERLMLGRALWVYYPVKFNVWPLLSPVNRFGPIR